MQQMKEIDFRLQELMPKIKELNQICKELKRDKVRYETAIQNEVRPDKTKISKIVIKVFENYENQEEFGQIPMDVFTDDVYLDVRQFYEEAEEEDFAEAFLADRTEDGEIFGWDLADRW